MIRRFPLEELHPQDFEKLVVLLCERILGTGTLNFTDGPDGGRDAVFKGKADHFPSTSMPWEGRIVIQAKHFKYPLRSCNDSVFRGKLEKEVNGPLKKLIANGQLDYYLLFTNAKLSANTDAGLTDFIQSDLGVESRIIGDDRIYLWLAEYPEIVKTMGLNTLLLPLQFYPEDLKDIILKFSAVSGRLADQAKKKESQLKWLDKEKKNQLNDMSKEYFEHMQKKSLAHFNSVESFLKNPLNKKYLDAYDTTVSELDGKIASKRSAYSDFGEIIESLYDFVIEEFPELKERRRLIRVFLHYMYFNCDIGLEG